MLILVSGGSGSGSGDGELKTVIEKDRKELIGNFCRACGYCMPCPVGIDVASVLKFLNLAKAQGTLPETVREHYALLEHPAGACISCGSCEQRCPFGVQVMEHMRQAREVFGK